MKKFKLIPVTLLLFLVGCVGKAPQDNKVRVELTKEIVFTWNNSTYEIEKDSLFEAITKVYQRDKYTIANMVSKSEKTRAIVCGYDENLTKGQLSYLLINSFELIPVFRVFDMQFDVYDYECQYPLGLLDYLHTHRFKAQNKLLGFLDSIPK